MRLCVDLGGSSARSAVMDGPSMLASRTTPISAAFDLETLRRVIGAALIEFEKYQFEGIALAVPGVLDAQSSVLIAAHDKYEDLQGSDLPTAISSTFGLPVGLANDARAALLGELQFGEASGETDAVLMILGTGIGTAAVMGGSPVVGRHGHAGILGGHVTVDLNAPECPCGNIGCAESLASTWALGATLERDPSYPSSAWARGTHTPNLRNLALLAKDGDDLSRRVLARFLRAWAAALVNLCHAYDPATVIITGGVLQSAPLIVPELERYLNDHLWSSSYRPKILVPAQPQLSVLRGLSALQLAQQNKRK